MITMPIVPEVAPASEPTPVTYQNFPTLSAVNTGGWTMKGKAFYTRLLTEKQQLVNEIVQILNDSSVAKPDLLIRRRLNFSCLIIVRTSQKIIEFWDLPFYNVTPADAVYQKIASLIYAEALTEAMLYEKLQLHAIIDFDDCTINF